MTAAFTRKSKCYLCGVSYHNRRVCPARDTCCNNCNKKDVSGKFVVQTPVHAQQLQSMSILMQ